MLSCWVIESAAAAVSYFEKDNYYTKDGGYEHSSWVGKGAKELGLNGEIKPTDFQQVLLGKLPNGEEIATKTIGKDKDGNQLERRPGTDLTFSAPKSVSIAALVAGDTEIIEAHKRAVTTALKFAEEHSAVCIKKKKRKNYLEKTNNLLIARFDHDTARETEDSPPDPQLHSHCVVINATKRNDGKWVASPNDLLLEHKMLLGAIYRAELAQELQHMGYRVRRTHNDGRFEIVGINREQIEGFSHRRADVEKYMSENGLNSTAGASFAAMKTRKKKKDTDRTNLREDWLVQAKQLGITLDREAIKRAPREEREVFRDRTNSFAAEEEGRKAVLHLSERQSVMGKYELLKIAMQRAVGFTQLADVQKAFVKQAKAHDLIKVDKERFTTPKLLDMEEKNLEMITKSLNAFENVVTHSVAVEAARAAGLNQGQREAVALLSARSRFVGVQGYAGTGKTSMLKGMQALAKAHGLEVRGFAPTAAAAKSIESESGIQSQTLESFLLTQENSKKSRSAAAEIWVVDEASMMSTQRCHRLFRLAERQNARVWLIGDEKQLGSIEAGGPFAMAVQQGMPYVEMKEILRQKDENLKAAVKLSIEDKAKESLQRLKKDVVEIKDRMTCLKNVVADYFRENPGIPKNTIVITSANEDRKEINSLIRSRLIDNEVLGKNAVEVPTLTKKHLTREETKRIWSYDAGDMVSFRRDYASLQIKKGDVFSVASVDTRKGSLTLKHRDTNNLLEWTPRRASKVDVCHPQEMTELRTNDLIRWTSNDKSMDIRNGETAVVKGFHENGKIELAKSDGKALKVDLRNFPHWDHAYCSTVYASQGKTCERVIIHLDTSRKKLLGKEQFYVAISRAEWEAKIFTNHAQALPKAIQVSRVQENAVEVRDAALKQTASEKPRRGFER